MRRVLPVLLALVPGCGSFGLAETASTGGSMVSVDPEGNIRFADTSPAGPPQEMEVSVMSVGDEPAYVADVWVQSSTDGVFSVRDDLPFPRNMEPETELPFSVKFEPPAAGTFHGTLEIESGLDGTLIERQLVGDGCRDTDGDGSC